MWDGKGAACRQEQLAGATIATFNSLDFDAVVSDTCLLREDWRTLAHDEPLRPELYYCGAPGVVRYSFPNMRAFT